MKNGKVFAGYDASKWDIPVDVIAKNRAKSYAEDFNGDVERSLKEDTLPLFAESNSEIRDWASGNMDWGDVVSSAVQVLPPAPPDLQSGWAQGDSEIIEK